MKTPKFALRLVLALTMGLAWSINSIAAESAIPEKTGMLTEAQAPAESATDAASAPETTANTGTVARAAFTSGIENREPTDKLNSLANDQGEIMFFTELRDMAGQSVTHRWEHNGEVMAEVPFNIGGNRWRVYSSKQLDPSWTGAWKASVISSAGEVLSVSTFNYEIAPVAPSEPTGATSATPATTETTTQ